MFSFISCGNMSGGREAQTSGQEQDREDALKKCTNLTKKMALLTEVNVDKEELIGLIQNTPALWDSRTDQYAMKPVRVQAWERITAHFINNFDQMSDQERSLLVLNVQKIWRNMRICYCREIKKAEKVKAGTRKESNHKYIYFERLKFLEAVSKKIPDPLDVTDVCVQDSESEEFDNKEWNKINTHEDSREAITNNKIRKRTKEGEIEIAEVWSQKKVPTESLNQQEVNEEDKFFLLSLLSEIHKVPAQNKLKLRSDIIAAIANAQALEPQQWLPMQYVPDPEGLQQNQLQKSNHTGVVKSKSHKKTH